MSKSGDKESDSKMGWGEKRDDNELKQPVEKDQAKSELKGQNEFEQKASKGWLDEPEEKKSIAKRLDNKRLTKSLIMI